MKKFLLFLMLGFFSLNLISSVPNPEKTNINKSIQIIDSHTGEKLTGVRISFKDTTLYTNFNGRINKKSIPDGTYIKINYISYKEKQIIFKYTKNKIKLSKEL